MLRRGRLVPDFHRNYVGKPENRLGGSSVAPSVAPIRGLTVSGSSSRMSRTDSTVS